MSIIQYKDLRLVYIKKQLLKDQIEIMLESDDYEKDTNTTFKNHVTDDYFDQNIIYTDEILDDPFVKLLYTLDINDCYEFI